ncbi:VCBS repeat-containing protein [Actinoplanes sp. ATCC 53533]|uniref:FG-GAP repeat domain-containing protein n=1 Tax=Actinoplanes sp. ATCC 53533 TaxID=1288362 RepID=UPI001F4299C9|nr:VCBS repeat-containing protein [Actinoplanes sp. ATCC 53533]
MRFSGLTGALFAAAVAAGSLSLPATARAAIPSTSCQPGGVTTADTAIARGLRSSMTGKRMGRSVNGYNISCARSIVRQVLSRGLPARAAVIAVTTAIAESTLHNYTLAVDHDSLGLFQQRPSMGWGRPEQLLDPGFATDAFLNKMIRLYPGNGWMAGDIGQISQRVQVSGYPAAYSPEANDARLIVGQLWTSSVAVTPNAKQATPKESTPKESTSKKPTGPFSKSLLKAVPGLPAAFDDRHQVLLADWNGDGHADLVVVEQSGTASGATEVRVMSGANNFQNLLLHTAIPMGPTDARYVFSMADWNFDGRFDLVVTQKSGTASGHTEVRVLDGASYLRRYLQETITPLGPTGDCHAFTAADWNADGRPDMAVVQKCGTASGHTEVRVLDGASNLQRYLQESATPLGKTDARHTFSVADWNGDLNLDLVVTQKSGPKSNETVLRVLDGASQFRGFLLKKSTAKVSTDDRHSLAVVDWNRDGRLDLVVVQKWGMAGGRTEARILAG